MAEAHNIWAGIIEKPATAESTEGINSFLDAAARDLSDITEGRVYADFCLPKTVQNNFWDLADGLSNRVLGMQDLAKNHLESRHAGLKDANELYSKKTFFFEICNSDYRFKVFSLEMTPRFPIEMHLDEGVFDDISNLLDFPGITCGEASEIEVACMDDFKRVFNVLLKSKKLNYIINRLNSLSSNDEHEGDSSE